ncbi:unnamed protein product [Protopolystoma xenopodis]|uniref:Uncharacterized protein n=1 Tax=Protopolystoma xenopodis TaxID=117903 RepID=A0A448XJT7_9PLAT|nr:unnamed protein product [Protopolystoma xenopodis]
MERKDWLHMGKTPIMEDQGGCGNPLPKKPYEQEIGRGKSQLYFRVLPEQTWRFSESIKKKTLGSRTTVQQQEETSPKSGS